MSNPQRIEKARAAVRIALAAARLGQTFGWWRIRELPQIDEVIGMLGALLDAYGEDEDDAPKPPAA